MPGPRLIDNYLAALAADLPPRIVEELADGLDETCCRYVTQGLTRDAAAGAAIGEFGDPQAIVTAFTQANPGRRTARRLLLIGPGAGLCWAIVLITARAWQWPVPMAARVAFGLALITVIALLAAAAAGKHYRSACRAAAAACIGTTILDVVMACTVLALAPSLIWPAAVAVAFSAGRSGLALRSLPAVLTK